MVEDGDEAQVAEEIQRVGQAVEDQVVAGGGTLEGAVQEALEAVGQRDQVGGWGGGVDQEALEVVGRKDQVEGVDQEAEDHGVCGEALLGWAKPARIDKGEECM